MKKGSDIFKDDTASARRSISCVEFGYRGGVENEVRTSHFNITTVK